MFLAIPAYAIESAVIGTMWKQEGTVVSPADDVTSVIGAGGGCAEGADCGFNSITTTTLTTSGDINVGGDIEIDGLAKGLNLYGTNSITGNLNFGLSYVSSKAHYFYLRANADKDGFNIQHQFAGDSFTASAIEQSIMDIEGKIEQTGTAAYNGIKLDVTETTLGDGTAGDGNNLLWLGIEGANKVKVDNEGTIANSGGIVYSGMTTVMGDYSTVLKDYAVFGNATSTSINVYLQDASLAEGQVKRIIKEDSTSNTVTLQPYSTQTISHATNYILRDHNSEILIMSRGGNWDRMQATPVSFYADMHLHDNSTSTIINTQNIPHFVQGLFTDDDSNGFTFSAGSSGALTVFADYSATMPGTVLATDVAHGLSTGDTIGITATTNYNGAFNVTVTGVDNFYFTDTFVADDGTGTWYQGDRYSVDPGVGAKFRVGWHCFGSPDSGGGADFEFELFINEAPVEKAESARTFGNSTDIGTLGGGGLIDLVDGDELSFSIINMTDTVNFTATHCNIGLDNI